MIEFNFQVPTEINFGSGKIKEIGLKVSNMSRKPLILTMKDIVEAGVLNDVENALQKEGINYEICDEVSPEPTCQELDILGRRLKNFDFDAIIGVGGGSVLDASKALAILLKNEGKIWDFVDLRDRPPRKLNSPNIPIIAVPTTSGTGSEVTVNSVLVNKDTVQKATIKFPSLMPKMAIIDPELTLSLPPIITGITGFDAFTHALESYMNKQKRSLLSDMLTRESMKLSYDYLEETIEKPNWLLGREKCALASLLAGISIANVGTTVAHAIGQPATARLGIPHGLAVSIFTIPVLKRTRIHEKQRFSDLAAYLDPERCKGLNEEQKAIFLVDLVSELQNTCGVNHKLRQYSSSQEIIEQLTSDTCGYMGRGLPQHSVLFDEKEIRDIISEAY